MKEEVVKLIQKADHALKVAEELINNGFPSDSVSKIYYAMFYAAQALLKSEDIEVKKHSAVESAIGYHFAKPGRIESKFHSMFINARNLREIADYDIQEEISESTAAIMLEEGKEFIKAIKVLLQFSGMEYSI